MNFANAVQTQEARTTNGMKAHAGSGDACVDLFYKVGALRKGDPIPPFTAALAENEDLALRIVQWARDVRGGAGEREVFRKILAHMETRYPELAMKLIDKIPEIGRWDDLFILKSKPLKEKAFTLLGDALRAAGVAKQYLSQLDGMTEEQCLEVLKTVYNYNHETF